MSRLATFFLLVEPLSASVMMLCLCSVILVMPYAEIVDVVSVFCGAELTEECDYEESASPECLWW